MLGAPRALRWHHSTPRFIPSAPKPGAYSGMVLEWVLQHGRGSPCTGSTGKLSEHICSLQGGGSLLHKSCELLG